MRLFTVGTDHRKSYDFTRILFKHGVEVVFDIRRSPEAPEEHFRRAGLQALLAGQHIDYVFLGNELGGPQPGQGGPWLASDESRRGVDIIHTKAGRRVCCILCTERTPEHCHRLEVGRELARQGIEVVHLLDENSFWQPPPVQPRPNRPLPPRGPRRGPPRFRRR